MTVPKIKRKKAKRNSGLQIVIYACILSLSFAVIIFLLRSSDSAPPQNKDPEHTKNQSANVEVVLKGASVENDKGGVRGSASASASDVLARTSSEPDSSSSNLPKTITMKTSQGDIRIKLRPDLSLASVQYIQKLLESRMPCEHCRIYRAEKPGILQGNLIKEGVEINKVLGDCPEEFKNMKHDCPPHDPKCGCHGPIMKRGMIAW